MKTCYRFLGAVILSVGLLYNASETFANVYAAQLMITNPDGTTCIGISSPVQSLT